MTIAWAASAFRYLTAGTPIDLSITLLTSGIATALFGPNIWRRSR